MDSIINEISKKELNSESQEITSILDKGVRNKVFKVSINDVEYIFRINSKDEIDMYLKEEWCINEARKIEIKTSECLHVGTMDEYSYMILNYIEGTNGDDSDLNKKDIFKSLGKFAKKFNSVKTNGFGREISGKDLGFTQTWQEFHDSQMKYFFNDTIFVDNDVLSIQQLEIIKARLSEMKEWKYKPSLCHGNLGPKNTVVTPQNEIYVIDWGNGAGNIAPHVDLADIIAWKSTRIYLDDFLEGYGMTKEEFENIEHEVNNILIIQLIGIIKWSIEKGNNFLDKKFIEQSIERIMVLK